MRFCIDSPTPGGVYSGIIPIHGWVISDADAVVEVYLRERRVANLKVDRARPDVMHAHHDFPHALYSGFAGVAYSNSLEDGTHLATFRLRDSDGDKTELASFPIHLETRLDQIAQPYERVEGFQFRRTPVQAADRFRRLAKILQCPHCSSDELALSPTELRCKTCDRHYNVVDSVPVFYLQPERDSEPCGPVSTNPYPKHVIDHIRAGSGLVLDYGAGGRPYGYDNVIQAEIARYGFTDIVVDPEARLPFKNNVFRVVLSLAVLEHVRNPWFYVREIHRVLKPDGIAFIDSAFLQPVHGYPYHYFNTTLAGLKELCKQFEIVSAGVRPYQEPWVSLVWFLQAYTDGLDGKQREGLLDLRVGELLEYLKGLQKGAEDTVGLKKIDPRLVEEMAAGVYVECRKKVLKQQRARHEIEEPQNGGRKRPRSSRIRR